MGYLVSDLNNYLSRCNHIFEFFRSVNGVLGALLDRIQVSDGTEIRRFRSHMDHLAHEALWNSGPFILESREAWADLGTHRVRVSVDPVNGTETMFHLRLYEVSGDGDSTEIGEVRFGTWSADLYDDLYALEHYVLAYLGDKKD